MSRRQRSAPRPVPSLDVVAMVFGGPEEAAPVGEEGIRAARAELYVFHARAARTCKDQAWRANSFGFYGVAKGWHELRRTHLRAAWDYRPSRRIGPAPRKV